MMLKCLELKINVAIIIEAVNMDEFPHRHHRKLSADGVVKDLLDTIQSK